MASAVYYHATIFRFSLEGAEELIRQFSELVQNETLIDCRYMFNCDMFRIQCPEEMESQPYDIFADLCSRYLSRKNANAAEPDKFMPMIETQICNDIDFENELLQLMRAESETEEHTPPLVDTNVTPDTKEDGKTLWSPVDARTDVAKLFPSSVLEEITIDTGCALQVDTERRLVVISKTAVAFVDAAMLKLSHLERDAHRTRITVHVVRTERQTAQLALIPLKKVPDAMLRALFPCNLDDDLVPTRDAFTDEIPTMRTLRMMELQAVRPWQNPYPPPPPPSPHLIRLWGTNSFPVFGNFRPKNTGASPTTASRAETLVSEVGSDELIHPQESPQTFTTARTHPSGLESAATTLLRLPAQSLGSVASTLGPKREAVLANWIDSVAEAGTRLQDLPPPILPKASQVNHTLPDLVDVQNTTGEQAAEEQISHSPTYKLHELSQNFVTAHVQDSVDPISERDGSSWQVPGTMSRISEPRHETPLRYEHTDFHQYDWEKNLVQPGIPNDEIIDASGLAFHSRSSCNQFPLLPSSGPTNSTSGLLGEGPDLISFGSDCGSDLEAYGQLQQQQRSLQRSLQIDNIVAEPKQDDQDVSVLELQTADALLGTVFAESEEQNPDEIVEKLQTVNEVDSRQYCGTMRQRKGKKAKPISKAPPLRAVLELPDPLPIRVQRHLVDSPDRQALTSHSAQHQVEIAPSTASPTTITEQSGSFAQATNIATRKQKSNAIDTSADNPMYKILPALDQARSFRGEIRMEIQFGQTILHNFKNNDAKKFTKTTFGTKAFEDGLNRQQNEENLSVIFNQRMTTSLLEAFQALVLFDPEPEVSRSWYEFICTDHEGRKICIKAEGSDKTETESVPEVLGCVFFHYPKRVFDARCVVSGSPKCTQSVEDFMSMMTARKIDDELANVSWHGVSKAFEVESVYAKRQVCHRGLEHEKFSLQITEVQHLLVSRQDDGSCQAYAESPENMIVKQRKWFETSIVMSQHPLLSQNKSLQTGDDAEWQPEDILSDDVLRDMMTVTEHMVTRMDGIGASNRGPRGEPHDIAEIARADKEKEAERTGLYQPYW
ncbi:hypothetical protein MBLNU459_g5503t1 [Dothideomycetes sp. NU459]